MPPTPQPPTPSPADNTTPPLFATWRGWYALVLGALVAELIGFTLLTRWFA